MTFSFITLFLASFKLHRVLFYCELAGFREVAKILKIYNDNKGGGFLFPRRMLINQTCFCIRLGMSEEALLCKFH